MRDCASPDARLSLSLPLSLSLSLLFAPSLSLSRWLWLPLCSLSLTLAPSFSPLSFFLSLSAPVQETSAFLSSWHVSHAMSCQNPRATQRSTTLSSQVNLPHAINFRAVCGANLVTLRSKFRAKKNLVLHRVEGGCLESARQSSRKEGRVLRRLFRAHNLPPAFAGAPDFVCALQRGRRGVLHAVRVCGGEGVVRISV